MAIWQIACYFDEERMLFLHGDLADRMLFLHGDLADRMLFR